MRASPTLNSLFDLIKVSVRTEGRFEFPNDRATFDVVKPVEHKATGCRSISHVVQRDTIMLVSDSGAQRRCGPAGSLLDTT